MASALVGEDGDVGAAKYHLDSTRAERMGKLKSWFDGTGLDADTGHIPVLVEG